MKKIKFPKIHNITKVTVCLILATTIIGTAVLASGRPPIEVEASQTIILEKTNISKVISVSGVVESALTKNIYATQSYPVKEIYVQVGDSVRVGDVLAELDMSRLENDISQTEINLKSAITSANEERTINSNNIANAQTSLESSQISYARQQITMENAEKDLREAEEKMSEEFDGYTFDLAIGDAKLSLERKTTDLEKAQEDWNKAMNHFDDYPYQNAINEAAINLERRQADLEDTERFDDYLYQNAIKDAVRNHDRKKDDYDTARNDYFNAQNDYFSISGIAGISDTEILSAWTKVESAQKAMDAAGRAIDDAEISLARAKTDLQRAKEDERPLSNAENAVNDAQRTYDKAVTDLERAKRDAVDSASEKLTNAKNAYSDAQRSYEKALNDKIRAIDNENDNHKTKLESVQKTYIDTQKQLESSQNNVQSAQNSLHQAQSKSATQGTGVEIQELNLEKLSNQLAEGKIVATADGVITEVNVKIGSTPNGILFVIEDTEDLYVSANVKEYNVSDVFLGKDAVITTEATGNQAYEGTVSYISPKAVSAAGSTSVEFEVQVGLNKPDTAIKIGMNAFLNIIAEHKSNVFVVPNSAIVTNERGNFVYTMGVGEKQEIAVTLGIRTAASTEISGDGLYEGMQLMTDPEGLISNEPSGRPAMFGGMGGQ